MMLMGNGRNKRPSGEPSSKMKQDDRDELIEILQKDREVPPRFKNLVFPPERPTFEPLFRKVIFWAGFQVLLPVMVVCLCLWIEYLPYRKGQDLFNHVVSGADLMLIAGLLFVGVSAEFYFSGAEVKGVLKDLLFTINLIAGVLLLIGHSLIKAQTMAAESFGIGKVEEVASHYIISTWAGLLVAAFGSLISLTLLELLRIQQKQPKTPPNQP